jgi:peptidoglycan/xylan/chitin deacetylase (PgdA/CDA1 family)
VTIIALEYHDVVANGDWDGSGFAGAAAATYKHSVSRFEEHLAAIRQTGCDVTARIDNSSGVRHPVVALTFDDGGSGYLAHAADLLERHGWRGYVFMTTGCLGKPGFLSADDLRALHGRGHVIGTHSRTHPVRLSALSPAAIRDEWRTSIADLESALGAPVRTGSVPGGYHSRAVAAAAAECGLQVLFTSEPESRPRRHADCLVVGRYTLRQNHRGHYAARLVGRDPSARLGQWWRWNAKKVVKSIGGTAYLRLRDRLLER